MQTILPITSDAVPAGFCPINDKDWQALVSLLHATLTGDPSVNTGNVKPTPDNRGKPWIRTNGDGTPDATYSFVNGLWAARYSIPPGIVAVYAGDPADIPTLDGGNTNPVSSYDGPFWEVLPSSDAKFLVGAGTTPVPPTGLSTVLSVGATGGQEVVILSDLEIAHAHKLVTDEFANPRATLTTDNWMCKQSNDDGAGDANSYYVSAGAGTAQPTLGNVSALGGNSADRIEHTNMPPYLVVTFIQRTVRLFKTQSP